MEAIWKLQPNRSLALRGFDDRGAAAALVDATDSSFRVAGVFRDSADFCVLVVYDADDFFHHPRQKPLPDFNFADVTLEFDVTYSGLIPLDSSLFPSIDWPYLDVIREDGTSTQVRLVPSVSRNGTAGPWHVSVDFSALGIERIRQMWLTFAPPIPEGVAFGGGEWEAIFSSWQVTGANRSLQVAGSGSVRVEETDAWCTYTGTWATESGFYSKGFARATSNGAVTVRWHCQSTHDLYLGTSLYVDRGVWGISIDGGSEIDLDTYLSTAAQVNARRLIRSGMSAGQHVATLRHKSGGVVYFDFLEAAVPSDVPEAAQIYTDRAPANDYGTDHAYKLSPARLMWMMDSLGYAGPMNFYISVFWWNQRRVDGRVLPSVSVSIPGAAVVAGNNVFIQVGSSVWGRFVLGGDTPTIVAAAIAASLNADAVGVWASSSGDTITITNRAATSIYSFTFDSWYEAPAGAAHTPITYTGSLMGGTPGTWVIDETLTPVLNAAARAYLADLCAECAARGREITFAFSMELLNPPASWAALYPDGTPVTTATGFSTNFTTHCAFLTGVVDYQKQGYREVADLMAAAGLEVRLQFGEFLWWYFAEHGGMAFYDATTQAAASAALGRALHVFTGPNDDPTVNSGADADFLRSRLVAHCAAIRSHVVAVHSSARFEILLALDVTYPSPVGRYGIGGRLNNSVNIPNEFRDPASAPFDVLKIEALDFGASTRSLTLARWAIGWGQSEASWPLASTRYLLPLFNGGCPWQAELDAAIAARVQAVTLYAFDHVCIFGWEPSELRPEAQIL